MQVESPTHRGRVLFVTSTFPRWAGDASAPFVLHLARDLRALGWDVHVLAPHAAGATFVETIDGVPVRRFPYLWPPSLQTLCYEGGALSRLRANRWRLIQVPVFVAAESIAVARHLLAGRFDIVHSHWILPQGVAVAASARPLGVPHVTTVHGSDVFSLRGKALAAFKRFALTHADVVTVNSSATAAAALKLAPGLNSLVTLPMGVSVLGVDQGLRDALHGKHRVGSGPLLAFAGRLVPEKGVDDLLTALALLSRDLPDASLLVIGDGPERRRLEERARKLGVDKRVCFSGWVDPAVMPSWLAAADVFVGPSKGGVDGTTEALGLVFAEAMLAGTPVVATRIGGIPDIVRHGETGLLVDPASPIEIAQAIQRLLRDPELASQLVENGRAHVRAGFTRQIVAARMSEVYASLCATRSKK